MTLTIETMLELAEQQARTVLLDKAMRSLAPTWAMADASGDVRIFATPWRDDIEKDMARIFVTLQIKAFQATQYSLLFEAYLSTCASGELDKHRPKDDPERIEVVMAMATDGKKTEWKQWEIKRDWNERVIALEEREMKGYKGFKSWMCSLLDEGMRL